VRVVANAGHAPAVFDVVDLDDRSGIIYERVDGPSMLAALTRQPWAVLRCARLLADLHLNIHESVVAGLPSQRARLEQRVRESSLASAPAREAALRLLERLPGGDKLCHGDFHPDNVILSTRGAVVIDWNDATQGNP